MTQAGPPIDEGTRLLDVARQLVRGAAPARTVVIGGVCANLLGLSRHTLDVDLAVEGDPLDLLARLEQSGIQAQLRRGDRMDALPWVIAGTLDDIPFQLLPAAQVADPAESTELEELGIRILTLRQFVLAKLRAAGWRDLYDVARMILLHPALREEALQQAGHLGVEGRLRAVLDDPRLAADARKDEEVR